jgi:HAMP domain-containing protein
MARARKSAEARDDQSDQLANAVNRLADEIHVLREAIDQLRSQVWHGILNNKFRCEAQTPSDSPEPVVPRHIELDDDHAEAIVEAVKDGVQDMAADVAETVRDELKQELGQLKDEMDKFSIDAQWAARKIREKPADEIESLSETFRARSTTYVARWSSSCAISATR